jgi:uncharacterized membrane protein YphA (DoxX/SURF4 family)
MKINSENGKIILRISLALVFLWFGINQVYSQSEWVGFIPDFLSEIINPNLLVLINGSFEIILGIALITGFYTRLSALLLSLHLFGIALSIGYNPIAIRDLGLALATLSIFFNGTDKWCYDKNKI